MKRVASVPFNGTKAQEDELRGWLREHKGEAGTTLPALQKAQGIYGYVPFEVQKMIADELEVPLEEVYGISTFYAQFKLFPAGKYQINVCLGTACYVKGSDQLVERVKTVLGIDEGECTPDGKFSLTSCRCVGACGLAPVLLVNEDVYGRLTPGMVDDILKKYE